jgi:hypothetical protein
MIFIYLGLSKKVYLKNIYIIYALKKNALKEVDCITN